VKKKKSAGDRTPGIQRFGVGDRGLGGKGSELPRVIRKPGSGQRGLTQNRNIRKKRESEGQTKGVERCLGQTSRRNSPTARDRPGETLGTIAPPISEKPANLSRRADKVGLEKKQGRLGACRFRSGTRVCSLLRVLRKLRGGRNESTASAKAKKSSSQKVQRGEGFETEPNALPRVNPGKGQKN